MRRWLNAIAASAPPEQPPSDAWRQAAQRMRTCNPKFVPREWMLVAAYQAAERAEFEPLFELMQLFQQPFAEQSEALSARFFRKASAEELSKPGTSFMS